MIAIQRNTKKCEFHTVMYYNSRIHACTEERKDIIAHSVCMCMCKYWSVYTCSSQVQNRTILNILSTLLSMRQENLQECTQECAINVACHHIMIMHDGN